MGSAWGLLEGSSGLVAIHSDRTQRWQPGHNEHMSQWPHPTINARSNGTSCAAGSLFIVSRQENDTLIPNRFSQSQKRTDFCVGARSLYPYNIVIPRFTKPLPPPPPPPPEHWEGGRQRPAGCLLSFNRLNNNKKSKMASIFLALSDIIMAEIYMLLLKQRYLTDSIPDAKSGWCFPDSLRIVKFNVLSVVSGKILTLQCTSLQKEIITHYNGVYDTLYFPTYQTSQPPQENTTAY